MILRPAALLAHVGGNLRREHCCAGRRACSPPLSSACVIYLSVIVGWTTRPCPPTLRQRLTRLLHSPVRIRPLEHTASLARASRALFKNRLRYTLRAVRYWLHPLQGTTGSGPDYRGRFEKWMIAILTCNSRVSLNRISFRAIMAALEWSQADITRRRRHLSVHLRRRSLSECPPYVSYLFQHVCRQKLRRSPSLLTI